MLSDLPIFPSPVPVPFRFGCKLKFGEQFRCRDIRMRFQMLEHLRPVIQKALRTGPAAARLVAEAAVFESPDHHAPSTGVLSPNLHALGQTIHVRRMKTSWELDAQLLEQLRRCHVPKPLEAAAHQWPDHRERVIYRLAGFGTDQRGPFRYLRSGRAGRVGAAGCMVAGGSIRAPSSTAPQRGIDFPVQRHSGLQLEQLGSRKLTQRYHS
jgi:hypothetical protein